MLSIERCFIVSTVIVHSLAGEAGLPVTTDEIMTQFNFELLAGAPEEVGKWYGPDRAQDTSGKRYPLYK